MDHGAAIDQLDRDLQRFQIEMNKYFAGALELPPEALQKELAARIRELRSRPNPSVALQFRLNGLTDRFRAFDELFRRRLREEESGARSRSAEGGPFELDVHRGVVIDGSPAAATVRALFDELYRGREERASSFDAFRSYLLKELDSIRARTGCSQVRFRVETAGERPRLKALPLHEERS